MDANGPTSAAMRYPKYPFLSSTTFVLVGNGVPPRKAGPTSGSAGTDRSSSVPDPGQNPLSLLVIAIVAAPLATVTPAGDNAASATHFRTVTAPSNAAFPFPRKRHPTTVTFPVADMISPRWFALPRKLDVTALLGRPLESIESVRSAEFRLKVENEIVDAAVSRMGPRPTELHVALRDWAVGTPAATEITQNVARSRESRMLLRAMEAVVWDKMASPEELRAVQFVVQESRNSEDMTIARMAPPLCRAHVATQDEQRIAIWIDFE
jgi:hypothetical protein